MVLSAIMIQTRELSSFCESEFIKMYNIKKSSRTKTDPSISNLSFIFKGILYKVNIFTLTINASGSLLLSTC